MFSISTKIVETLLLYRNNVIYRGFSRIFGFKAKYPELFKYIHEDSRLLFENPFVGSSRVIKWSCPEGPDHIMEATLGKRISSFKKHNRFTCLYCLGRRVSVTNSLATRYPELAEEWCYKKNETLTPKTITYGSSVLVWWQCPNDSRHQYLASPNDRTYSHRECPYCQNSEVCSTNNLAVTYPSLVKQWDFDRNSDLQPELVLPTYAKKVWWKCDQNPNHKWECAVNIRVRLHWGCPFCTHRRFSDLSLQSLFPDMAKDWDYEKNDHALTADTISANSEKLIWWKCEHGIEWKQGVEGRKRSYLNGYHRCVLCRQKLQEKLEGEANCYNVEEIRE